MTVNTNFPTDQIAVIDLKPLIDNQPNGLERVANQIREAYRQVGFSYIINHGVPQTLIDRTFEVHRQFHARPIEEKMRLSVNQWHRGYIAINTSTDVTTKLADVTKPNQSESFMMMHERAPDDPDVLADKPLAGPNQWPTSVPHFKKTVQEYNRTLQGFCEALLPAIAVALGSQPADFSSYFREPTTFLRLVHYPPISGARPEDLYGSAPHTDYGFITVLAQDNTGGLQVRHPNGQWVDAPPMPGAFILNTGDITARWSNERFLSTPHRVYNRQDEDRYSIAFFYDPSMDQEISPLAGCYSNEDPPKFEPIIYGDFLMDHLNANHDYRTDDSVN